MNASKWARAMCTTMAGGMIVAAALWTPPAGAKGLQANIYLLQAPVPPKLSEKALLAFARGHANKLLREDTAAEVKTRKWKAEMVVSFNMPVDDIEFNVLFYDIHDGPRRFVDDMSAMLNDRHQKTYVQKVTLPRPQFKPNRNMELIVTVRRAEVGRLRFGMVGEEIKRSGEVSFSESER